MFLFPFVLLVSLADRQPRAEARPRAPQASVPGLKWLLRTSAAAGRVQTRCPETNVPGEAGGPWAETAAAQLGPGPVGRSRSGVPDLFGIRGQFCERQLFHELGVRGGVSG